MNNYDDLIEALGKHSLAAYPTEACGIITKDFKFVPCENMSYKPKYSFILNPITLLSYQDNTWGIFHSHPGDENPYPSEQDIKNTILQDVKYVVGFNNNFYIYWYNKDKDFLRYEKFEEHHCELPQSTG